VPSLDLSREYRAIGPMLLKAVEGVFSSQRFIMGPQVAEFERAAAEKCGVAHAIGCSSGTEALWLALEGVEIGPGDAVVTTAFSFFATVSAILRTGAQPLLADIDPETFNLDPAKVEARLRQMSSPTSCTPLMQFLHPKHAVYRIRIINAISHLQAGLDDVFSVCLVSSGTGSVSASESILEDTGGEPLWRR